MHTVLRPRWAWLVRLQLAALECTSVLYEERFGRAAAAPRVEAFWFCGSGRDEAFCPSSRVETMSRLHRVEAFSGSGRVEAFSRSGRMEAFSRFDKVKAFSRSGTFDAFPRSARDVTFSRSGRVSSSRRRCGRIGAKLFTGNGECSSEKRPAACGSSGAVVLEVRRCYGPRRRSRRR